MAEEETLQGEDEDIPNETGRKGSATGEMPITTPGKQGILSQALVDRWCKDAKEKNSVAAFDRLMKVRAVSSCITHVFNSLSIS